jgi:hypothetical protein
MTVGIPWAAGTIAVVETADELEALLVPQAARPAA